MCTETCTACCRHVLGYPYIVLHKIKQDLLHVVVGMNGCQRAVSSSAMKQDYRSKKNWWKPMGEWDFFTSVTPFTLLFQKQFGKSDNNNIPILHPSLASSQYTKTHTGMQREVCWVFLEKMGMHSLVCAACKLKDWWGGRL